MSQMLKIQQDILSNNKSIRLNHQRSPSALRVHITFMDVLFPTSTEVQSMDQECQQMTSGQGLYFTHYFAPGLYLIS